MLFDLLIAPAHAQATPAGPGGLFDGGLMSMLPMVAIFVVFYFLLIRPQQKRAKETKTMLEALQKGDEVVTAGGVSAGSRSWATNTQRSKSRPASKLPCSGPRSRSSCPRARSRPSDAGFSRGWVQRWALGKPRSTLNAQRSTNS